MCADALQASSDDFSPFCEYSESAPDFPAYVARVRSSADWGGHLELRALSRALERSVYIYKMAASGSSEPIVISDSNNDDVDPIRVSYHQHYYALGEHYNQVVKKC